MKEKERFGQRVKLKDHKSQKPSPSRAISISSRLSEEDRIGGKVGQRQKEVDAE